MLLKSCFPKWTIPHSNKQNAKQLTNSPKKVQIPKAAMESLPQADSDSLSSFPTHLLHHKPHERASLFHPLLHPQSRTISRNSKCHILLIGCMSV